MTTKPQAMSDAGLRFLEDAEGTYLHAYPDSRGIPTIGVGHTGPVRGQAITLHPQATVITREESEALLRADLADAEAEVLRAVGGRDDVTQGAFDALVSFVFNVGGGHFRGSSAFALLRGGAHLADVGGSLLLWRHAGADPVELASRRARELYMLLEGLYLGNAWKEIK